MKAKKTSKLDHLKMLQDIDALVETDFAFEMDCKTIPNSTKYTQDEALQMAGIIGKVYSIAHCLTCRACQTKYIKKGKK